MNIKISRFLWSLQVFLRIMQRDMYILVPTLKSRTINIAWWTVICVYMFEYVGLSTAVGYGLFIAASECAVKGYLRALPCARRIISDFHDTGSLYYYLTLPVPQWLIFISLAASASLELMAIDIWILPIAKLILWNKFQLSFLGMVKVASVFFCSHLFYGTCVLLFASIPTQSKGESLFTMRGWIELLFFTGGYFFTWHQLYTKSHVAGYFSLLNPLMYAAEGMRSAIFGNPESLPVWICCLMLLVFTVFAGAIGTWRMMKKVDCF